ncbi:hypothetical protein [Pseudodesulfovibrio nedwellii]|uniref:hypothetical protein n=1 Tax=Pseudodesulfovibrio nedwellii TaxID=2973072 RepID=UPI002491C64F|nr:hypothetical protein [Pseudodesulfovibrio nedwellii]
MKSFKFSDSKSLYYNWFKLQSYVLFPRSPTRRKKTFDFLYYRFLFKHRGNPAFELEKVSLRRTAEVLDRLIVQRKFFEALANRRHSVITAAIMGRLFLSMTVHDFPEPSQNKAVLLYNYRFSDRREDKGHQKNYGVRHAKDSLNQHRDVLPYCVANMFSKPVRAQSCEEFGALVEHNLCLAESFKDYCERHTQARLGGVAKAFVYPDKLLSVEYWKKLSRVKQDTLFSYSQKQMVKYAIRAGLNCPKIYSLYSP